MFVGQHNHKLDDKSRLSLPAKFRQELGQTVIITHGLDQCLFVYPKKEWRHFSNKISELSMGQADSRAFSRFLLSGAMEVDIDSSGRVLIPEHLRKYAKIEQQVVVTGVHNRIELWSLDMWEQYIANVSSKADDLAEHLGSIGMI